MRLAENGTPAWALGSFALAILTGIAQIVKSLDVPMTQVTQIVETRQVTEDDARRLPAKVGANGQGEGGGRT